MALNTRCFRSSHTNFTSSGKSKLISYGSGRPVQTELRVSANRQTRPWAPKGTWDTKQLDAFIRLVKHYHLAIRHEAMLSEHVRTNHPSTSVLRDRVQAALSREADSAPEAALQKIDAILLEASTTVYPPRPRT